VVVLDGAGAIEIDGEVLAVAQGDAVLIPRGCVRSITAAAPGLRYLTVHGRRDGLRIGRKDGIGV
jgi:quercetin dioxygenase-like cupin family protein